VRDFKPSGPETPHHSGRQLKAVLHDIRKYRELFPIAPA